MSLSTEDLKKLARPFDASTVCVKVQSLSKAKDMAALVCYIQHTDYYARIEEVDAAWSNEITCVEKHPPTEKADEYFTVRMKMKIKGVVRENIGDGLDEKSATSDALKRVGMLFSIARYLYDSQMVWVPYDKERDYYKTFTLDEYHAAMRPGQTRVPIQSAAPDPQAAASPKKPAAQIQPLGRDIGKPPKGTVVKPLADPEANAKRAACADLFVAGQKIGKSVPDLNDFIKENWGKPLRDMTLEEMGFVKTELERLYQGEPAEGDFQP